MIITRKHTIASTSGHVSSLERTHRRGNSKRCFAALIVLLFASSAIAIATPRPGQHVGKQKPAEPSTGVQTEKIKPDARVPIKIDRFDTPDGPGIIAIIGDFRSDLDEGGQAYLEREFFEHVVAAVLLVDDSPDSEFITMIEVAMLPQKKNQREGNFILGQLKGHIIVVVEKRRVIVKCTFREALNQPLQIAAVDSFFRRVTSG